MNLQTIRIKGRKTKDLYEKKVLVEEGVIVGMYERGGK